MKKTDQKITKSYKIAVKTTKLFFSFLKQQRREQKRNYHGKLESKSTK